MNQKQQLVTGVAVAVSVASMYFFVVAPLIAMYTPAEREVSRAQPQAINNPYQQLAVEVSTVEWEPAFTTEDIIVGDGDMALPGDRVTIHYVASLPDGTVFDTTAETQEPFSFTLGAEEAIQGLDIGVRGMREGGTRRITVPPTLGYGSNSIVGPENDIVAPANATLVFDVILMNVEKPE